MTVGREIDLLSNATLLEKVDKLRDLNIGQHVPLPQLVVVGDQSSGKSSLLESLSGIPFPKDQSLCTRHATRITSRRDSKDCVNIRIIPGPHATEEHKKHVEAFRMEVPSGSEFREQFVNILTKANERMGLRADISAGSGAVFSEDVLEIGVYGPREDYLAIIDVPGILPVIRKGTTKSDMVMVRNMVKRYMRNNRTIILAVLPSIVDIAIQEVLQLAEIHDKNGERTLGVLTKPDLVCEPSVQAAVCDLIESKKRPLTLGYFLVRNRGANCSSIEQSELDQIFQTRPWNGLPSDRVGISALRTQLSHSWLLNGVKCQIRKCERELHSLGPPRQDEREQRSFLSQISEAFQDRARAALVANYSEDPVFDQDELRLITHVVNITDIFSADFQRGAHSRRFENFELSESPSESEVADDCDVEEKPADLIIDGLRLLLQKSGVDDIAPKELAELDGIIVHSREVSMPCNDVTEWINDFYLQSRGLDLGTFNVNLVSMAFGEQSQKWGNITKIYMSRIIITIHRFIAATLRSVWPEEQARDQLWSTILESLVERYKVAMDQANLLIEAEQRKQPYTLNRQINEALSKARGYRVTELLRPKDDRQYRELQYMVNLDDIAEAAEGKRNVDHLQEVHDILRACYSLVLDRFIDNVFQLAVDYSLLHGPSSPLKVFTQDWVINLEPEQLEQIVGETKPAKKRRSKLAKKIGDLSKALKILKIISKR